MRYLSLLILCGVALSGQAADSRIYRCGNVYTNTVTEAQAKSCTVISDANVTVIPSVKPRAEQKSSVVAPTTPSAMSRVDAMEQRNRDNDARMVLEAELRKAQTRQAELRKEFNGGEPEKLGSETRNLQKYQDRVAELKATIERNESDIAGLQRELGRLPAGSSSGAAK